MALFLAVIITVLRGESANLLSIGAIDLGIIVDAHRDHGGEHLPPSRASHAGAAIADRQASLSDKLHRVLTGAVEVDKAIFFSVIITIAAFLPLFTMQGVEGQIFGPMARTYAYALIGAVIATFTVTPVLASILLPAQVQEVETFLVRAHPPGLPGAFCRARCATIARRGGRSRAVFLVLCGVLGARLGTEFLPKLEEGNMWIRAVMPPTITLEAGMDTVAAHPQAIIRSYRAGADGRFRAGPRRRGHRSGRLVPGRVLRAAEAAQTSGRRA